MVAFRLNPLVARWLRVEPVPPSNLEGPDWDHWLLRHMSQGEILDVGGVLVDRAVLRQQFSCVSELCAPRPGRERYRSCCADVFVALSPAEDRRLASCGSSLLDWMKAKEPRLRLLEGSGFYRDEAGQGLARPGGRCVFSQIDQRGRIRCRLHAYAKHAGVDRGNLQPLSCRLFPLIIVDRGRGRVLLTVVTSDTRRLVGAHPPNRYPCLRDAKLPPLFEALRDDLDWVFGNGFAHALAQAA